MAEQEVPEQPVQEQPSGPAGSGESGMGSSAVGASHSSDTGQPNLLGKMKTFAARKKSARQAATTGVSDSVSVAKSAAVDEAAEARARFDEQRMTRRAALRRFGVTAGIGAAYMLSVDDLARACISRMQEQEFTREIGETLSAELGNSGMAVAATAQGSYYY